jgi:hypothetical protein
VDRADLPAAPKGKNVHAVDAAALEGLVAEKPRGEAAARRPAVAVLRAAGFTSVGTPEGPALRRGLADGGEVLVRGADGGLAFAKRFAVSRHDAAGARLDEDVLDDVDAILGWGEGAAAAPRM